MTYEENLRKTAEEMAKEDRDTSGARAYIKYISASRYCLKKQAEAYLKGLRDGHDRWEEIDSDIELKQLGLIP